MVLLLLQKKHHLNKQYILNYFTLYDVEHGRLLDNSGLKNNFIFSFSVSVLRDICWTTSVVKTSWRLKTALLFFSQQYFRINGQNHEL